MRRVLMACFCVALTSASCVSGAEPTAAASANSDRLAVPTDASRSEAKKLIAELYAEEFKDRSLEKKVALAQRLLEDAQQEGLQPPSRYVLLQTAADLFAESGDSMGVVEAAAKISARFEVDRLAETSRLLAQTNGKTAGTDQHRELAENCLSVAESGELPADLDIMTRLVELGESAANRAKLPDLRNRARTYSKELRQFKQEYTRVESAKQTLTQSPDDQDANLIVAQFLCFTQLDWDRGLPMLVKGADAGLRAAAEADLAGPAETRSAGAIGDLWWDLSEKNDGSSQKSMQLRAAHWYEQALPSETGLRRSLLEKRLASVTEAGVSLPATAALNSSGAIKGRLIVVNKGDCQVWLNGRPFYAIPKDGPPLSPPLLLRSGDIVVVRVDGRFVYRGARITFLSSDGSKYLVVRKPDLKDVTSLDPSQVTPETLAQIAAGANNGRPDEAHLARYKKYAAGAEQGDWFFGPERGTFQFAFTVSEDMYTDRHAN